MADAKKIKGIKNFRALACIVKLCVHKFKAKPSLWRKIRKQF
jgi:hypothetical protein